jgi:hypothetical protein
VSVVAQDLPLPPDGMTAYRISLRDIEGDTSLRYVTAANPDEAIGQLVDAICAEHQLDVEVFNERYFITGVVAESAGGGVR